MLGSLAVIEKEKSKLDKKFELLNYGMRSTSTYDKTAI